MNWPDIVLADIGAVHGGGCRKVLWIVLVFSTIRVVTLSAERVSLNQLGRTGLGALATMGVGFAGAAVFLWGMLAWDIARVGIHWVPFAWWTGALYAVAFGFYTAALARGPVSVVSPWSNATVVFLWMVHPILNSWAYAGLVLFVLGAYLLTNHRISWPVIWTLWSDVLLAAARMIDVHHVDQEPIVYATSLFTAIALWMLLAIVCFGRTSNMVKLVKVAPGWSFVAASSNASAYLSLFLLLRWIHPAAVESISAIASSIAAASGVLFLQEPFAKRKILSSALMTLGTMLLLFSQYQSLTT